MTTALATAAPATTAPATTSTEVAPRRRPGPHRGRAVRTAKAPRPRLVAVPDTEPPFDDERSSADRIRAARPPKSSTATDRDPQAPATAFRAAGTAAAPLVAVAVPDQSYAEDFGVERTPSTHLPPVGRVAVALSRALIETLTGVRPAAQLRVHCTPPVFAGLLQQIPLPGHGLARLQSVHTSEPADGIAEVSVVLRRGDRTRAIALRLTGLDGRWRISALQIG